MVKGRLSIDGEPAPMEPCACGQWRSKSRLCGSPADNTPALVAPAGNLFVGDNRDNSYDRRHQSPTYGVGFVPVELVIGRVIATFAAGSA